MRVGAARAPRGPFALDAVCRDTAVPKQPHCDAVAPSGVAVLEFAGAARGTPPEREGEVPNDLPASPEDVARLGLEPLAS